jgi:hypothetical protein
VEYSDQTAILPVGGVEALALAKIDLDVGFEVIEERRRKLLLALPEAAATLSASVAEVEQALADVLDLDDIADILNRDSIDIKMLLADYDFNRLRPEELCRITFAESFLPPDFPIFVSEAKVRFKGEIWYVHKTDADPFPSNPHAHNYQQRLKMHLGTGDLYPHRKKTLCGHIGRSNLIEFRQRIAQVNSTIELPTLAD